VAAYADTIDYALSTGVSLRLMAKRALRAQRVD
jgi:hypothetical protein